MAPPDRLDLDASHTNELNAPLLITTSTTADATTLFALPVARRSYWGTFALFAAGALTLIGACSDALQKLFGSGTALGVSDLSVAIKQANSSLSVVRVSYLLIGSLAAFMQSICLEKAFTQELVENALNLAEPEIESFELNKLKENPLFESTQALHWLEKLLIGTISACGAAVRGVSSLMGFYEINNSSLIEIKAPSISASTVDALQTIATEGAYLKKLYLLLRLWVRQQWQPADYNDDFLKAVRGYLDEEDYTCQTNAGRLVYFSTCLLLGSLAVSSDIGLAKLVIESFADLYGIDNNNALFSGTKWLGLMSLFLLMTAIDSKSLADTVTRRFENGPAPSTSSTPSVTSPSLIGLAGFVSLIGGSMTFLGAYEGNQYLFEDVDTGYEKVIIAFSILVATIKFFQSLAVEGSFTLKMARDSQWRPSCSIFKRSPPPSVAYNPLVNAPDLEADSGTYLDNALNDASDTYNPLTRS